MRKKGILIIALFISTAVGHISAQDASLFQIKNQLDTLLSGLDKTRVPTGYLLDAAVDLVDFCAYNGQLTDTNYVDIALFRDMIESVNSASVAGVVHDAALSD